MRWYPAFGEIFALDRDFNKPALLCRSLPEKKQPVPSDPLREHIFEAMCQKIQARVITPLIVTFRASMKAGITRSS